MVAGQNFLVFGASRGIGLGFVQHILTHFPTATVYATVRDVAKATDLQKVVSSSYGRVRVITADTSDQSSLKSAAQEVAKMTDSLDYVIYNAGVLKGFGNIFDVGIEPLKESMDTNVYGAYYATVAFAPFLLRSKAPHKLLILLTSNFGSLGLSNAINAANQATFGTPGFDPTAIYNISKTALNRLGQEFDHVLRPQGVPVLLIHPGLVKTDMNAAGNIDIDESVTGMLNVIETYSINDKELYYSYENVVLPW